MLLGGLSLIGLPYRIVLWLRQGRQLDKKFSSTLFSGCFCPSRWNITLSWLSGCPGMAATFFQSRV